MRRDEAIRYITEKYGKDKVPEHAPIPTHLLGDLWAQEWSNVYDLVEPMLLAPPVPIAELVSLLRGPEAEDLLRRLLFYSAEELLDEYFESDQVKAAFANESVIGHFSGPSAPGTAFTLAHNLLGNIDGQVGGWGIVLGGMGALPDALAAAARARGVEILLRSPVEHIRVRGRRAVGVHRSSDGRRLPTSRAKR